MRKAQSRKEGGLPTPLMSRKRTQESEKIGAPKVGKVDQLVTLLDGKTRGMYSDRETNAEKTASKGGKGQGRQPWVLWGGKGSLLSSSKTRETHPGWHGKIHIHRIRILEVKWRIRKKDKTNSIGPGGELAEHRLHR